MGRSADLALNLAAGNPCSPGETEWQPTDPALLSERSPSFPAHSHNSQGPLAPSPFSRRRGSDPGDPHPRDKAVSAKPAKEANVKEPQLLQELTQCEQEIGEYAERLVDEDLRRSAHRLSLLVAELRGAARPPEVVDQRGRRPEPIPGPVAERHRVLFVRAGRHLLGIVEDAVTDLHRLSAAESETEIETAFGAQVFRGPERLLPLIQLRQIVAEPPATGDGSTQIVSIDFGEQPFGLVVDEILGVEDASVCAMHTVFRKVGLYRGASATSGGGLALVLDMAGVASRGGMARLSVLPTAMASDQEYGS